MDRHTPPSPAPSRFDSLPSGFNELLQHNAAATSIAREPASIEQQHNQIRSQPTSRYGTLIPQLHRPHTFDTGIMQYQQRPGSAQLSNNYRASMYPHDSSPYGPIPETSQPYSTPATSPPTPSRASDIITTRSGNIIHRGAGTNNPLGPKSTRIEKNTKKRKTREKTKAPKNVPNLDKPMSQITLEVDVPVANIAEYVNRSCEVRRQEVETGKNPGRIKRPMNAFMLYRKAYQLRAKEWASQHNHQVVSRVCGLSWPMEPDEVREQFKAWAETERDNHQKAHPDYKFTPSKPSTRPPKSPARSRFDQSDGSDLEDLDWGTGGLAGGAAHGMRSSPYNRRGGSRTPTDDLDPYYPPGYGPPPGSYHNHSGGYTLADIRGLGIGMPNRSAYEYSNPPKTLAAAAAAAAAAGQYYSNNTGPRHLQHGVIEDVMMSSSSGNKAGLHSPSQIFHQQSSHHHLSAYPGGAGGATQQYHHEPSSQQQQQQQQQQHHPGQQTQRYERIDPSLMFSDGSVSGGMNSMLLDNSGGGGANMHHHQHHQTQSQAHQAWQTTHHQGGAGGGVGRGGGDDGQYSAGFMGLDETLSMDQASMEQQAQLLRGNPGEWHREELAPDGGEAFDLSWLEGNPVKGEN